MKADEINKRIQQEKNRHNQKVNKLKQDLCKENIRHQREIEYLQNKKNNLQKFEQLEKLDHTIEMALSYI